ncbi:hypothetical protein B0181_07295 [Moraxella caviae]|uniref:F0F1 ATP synthase subunit I n=1 Tax=Moraxella caviae TaxID=34060 RepID=A0A1T0A0J0_9GAMM|nr:ATP synthase subunit I [Moraxella caviae]OOR89255.1 hypothetical protein B0181_07295 [Moraxella caviae]STZ13868.1 F0F1 ATP synthase subunit I [Moraxella caviae]VEW11174.1 F0F1 ATP synthase subunit I [Moraxella caviae]
MSKPAERTQKAQILARQRRQIWVAMALIAIAAVCELALGARGFVGTYSLAAGVVLSFVAHLVFALIAYRQTGARARQAIMLNVYLGQMAKWAIALIGFALIFMLLKPIMPVLVIGGYVLMQFINAWALSYIK